jgi:ParB-like chromosome segregation protein Spo0J
MPAQQVVDLALDRLKFGLSPRAERYDPAHVAALAEVLHKVPPIVVHAPTMRVVDGVHRAIAARSAGRTTIQAVLFQGDEAEARIEAVRSNIAHGKPLSLAEREAAAGGILELVPDWSDRRVASVSGLSPKTVARLRRCSTETRATEDSAQLRGRVGRDGKLRPIDPSAVRRRVAEALRTDPRASNREIAKRTGASQATVRDVRQRLSQGASVVSSLSEQRRKRNKTPTSASDGRFPGVVPTDFAEWFEERHVDDTSWRDFVDAIPISRVYEIADTARARSESWRAFASALEDRARGRRRSNG